MSDESLSELAAAITEARYRDLWAGRDRDDRDRDSVLDRADEARTERRERGER